MIEVYRATGNTLSCTNCSAQGALPQDALWIDLLNPTGDEDKHVEALAGVSIPTRDDMQNIEESSRLYSENGALYLTVPVLYGAGSDTPGIAPVTFVVTPRFLVSVRYSQPKPFAAYAARVGKPGNDLVLGNCDPYSVLFGLTETITDRIAELLENVSTRLDAESARLLSSRGGATPMSTPAFRSGLQMLGKEGDLLSKIRESLASISRMLAYVQSAGGKAAAQHGNWIKSLDRDVQSLAGHLSFLSERSTFLLDTIVGLVSVEQNAIIKIFSVAAVVFMPPTLVASVYGMNFQHMPELGWVYGYPWALGLMAVSAVLPVIYFKIRGWL